MSSSNVDFTPEAIRAALKRAERDIRLNYAVIGVLGGLLGLVGGLGLKRADFSDPTHALIVLAAAWLCLIMMFLAVVLSARYDAISSRVIRALELLDEKLL